MNTRSNVATIIVAISKIYAEALMAIGLVRAAAPRTTVVFAILSQQMEDVFPCLKFYLQTIVFMIVHIV